MLSTFLVVGAALIAGCGFAIPWWRQRAAVKQLLDREALADDVIYEKFYASAGLSKSEVLEIWHDVADVLRVPANRLRPNDRFGKEVGVYWITSEDLDVLAAKGRERAKKQGRTVNLEKLGTVDEYVRCFSK
jgi:hypothetical protein